MMNDSKNKQVEPMNLEDDFFDLDTVACATECTGLIPTPPASDEEAESDTEIYAIPQPENRPPDGLQQTEGKSRTH